MKAVMSIEKGVIPGNPTFENPSPKSMCPPVLLGRLGRL